MKRETRIKVKIMAFILTFGLAYGFTVYAAASIFHVAK